ncbi:MAG: sulfite exporter TauE/SafE family protein [Pseudonocardiales bacterium]|nr:sulfite exporter TauE/SafE family protein [Pseudonocardiales bacterium]
MNLTAVLLTGLLAGGVSCAAVQGGLLAGLITRQRGATRTATPATMPAPAPARHAAPARAITHTTTHTTTGSTWSVLGDDLTPVGAFLTGKLLSHTLLGALLGALGTAVQPSVRVNTALQIIAGSLIITFGLAQLGVPGFRRFVIEPPMSFSRVVLRSTRSQTAFAPALLGLASILIPCGVTLSVEALALTSGSPAAGAATMAVFVLGTSPLFALLGYVARKAATAWRGRLAIATGVAVVIMGLLTLNGGLELAGSPLAASHLLTATRQNTPATSAAAASAAASVTVTGGRQTITIAATSDGYTPDTVTARAGIPTSLVIRSAGARGCIRSFTIPDRDLQKILPATGETRIELGALPTGTLDYACGMGMYTGEITAN